MGSLRQQHSAFLTMNLTSPRTSGAGLRCLPSSSSRLQRDQDGRGLGWRWVQVRAGRGQAGDVADRGQQQCPPVHLDRVWLGRDAPLRCHVERSVLVRAAPLVSHRHSQFCCMLEPKTLTYGEFDNDFDFYSLVALPCVEMDAQRSSALVLLLV